jgi:hypothetical protein
MRTAIQTALCAALLSAGCTVTLNPDGVEPPQGGGLGTGTFLKTTTPAIASNNSYPFTDAYDLKLQTLYAAAEVGGAGRISAIRFRRQIANTDLTCPQVAVRFGHTSLTALTTTFASNVNLSSIATALPYQSVTIPAGAVGTWFEVKLATPYEYDGVSNLVVEMETTAACTGHVFMSASVGANRRALANGANHNPSTADFTDSTQLAMQFVYSGGDDYLAYAGTLANTNSFPLSPLCSGQSYLNLHHAADIAGSGPVTGVAYQLAAPSAAGTYTVTVKLGHFAADLEPGGVLTTTLARNFAEPPVTVAKDVTFTVPAGRPAGDWLWIPTSGAFSYNGTDDLLVEVITSTVTGGQQPLRVQNRPGSRLWAFTGSTTGTVDNAEYHLGLRFNGGPLFVTLPASAVPVQQPLGKGGAGQVQSLYTATRLGTGGAVDGLSVRLANSSSAGTVPNVKVYMGQTTKPSLSVTDTYASNMDGQTLVFSGSLTVPGGLATGDWLRIPLQSSFRYDPTKNLVVLFTADGSGANNYVMGSVDSLAFPGCAVGRDDNSVGTSGVPSWSTDGIIQVRLDVAR